MSYLVLSSDDQSKFEMLKSHGVIDHIRRTTIASLLRQYDLNAIAPLLVLGGGSPLPLTTPRTHIARMWSIVSRYD
jgi:hypothetical protein